MRRPLIAGKDFEASIGQGEQIQGKVMKAYQGRKEFLCWGKENEENECVRKRLIFMCAKVLFMKKMCARNKQERISMTKPLEFYFKYLFFPNPPLDLGQTLKKFRLRGVEGSFQISASLGLL
jgi:hypothetical protein